VICTFLKTRLVLPEIKVERITEYTPQLAFVRKHKADIQKEMGAIHTMIQSLPEDIQLVVDGMAGSGFSGKVFKNRWPKASLLLNDLSKECSDSLKVNFPEDKVQNVSCENIIVDSPDFVFVDFNNFTKNRIDFWDIIFQQVRQWNPKYYMFTDSASYSFKFKKMEVDVSYYYELERELKKRYGWKIDKVCIFGNASLVLCGNTIEKRNRITFEHSSPIYFDIHNIPTLL